MRRRYPERRVALVLEVRARAAAGRFDDVDRLRRSARQMSALIHGLQVAVSTYKDLRHETRTQGGPS